jgi:hypothetical protein
LSPEDWPTQPLETESFIEDSRTAPPQAWSPEHRGEYLEDWIQTHHPGTRDRSAGGEGFERLLDRAIESSTWILSLPRNFDGEGSPAPAASTFSHAATLLRSLTFEGRRLGRPEFPLPRITPGPSGSIDLFWETESFELLVNVPADPFAPISFDGDNFGSVTLTGSIAPDDSIQPLLRWIQSP